MKEQIITNFELVQIIDNEPKISHRLLAEKTQNQEKTISRLIRNHIKELELFGHLGFEIHTVKNSVGAENEQKTFYLNEQQATLLLTFMRNNEIVINFKVRLVKEFFKMRQLLLNSEKPVSQSVQTSQTFDIKSYTQQNKELIDLIKIITSENAITLHYLDKLTQKLNLKSPLDLLQIDLNSYYFIPTELGKFLNKSAVEVNKILEAKGFQEKIYGVWVLTEKGEKYAIQLDNNFKTIKWKLESLV
jgi:phage regulator Rha-like protein